jgi:hypothetical protein
MFGGTAADALGGFLNGAASGEPLAVAMVILTLPLLSIPWLIWVFVTNR